MVTDRDTELAEIDDVLLELAAGSLGLPRVWPDSGDRIGPYVLGPRIVDRSTSRLHRAIDTSTGDRDVLVKVWHPTLDHAQVAVAHDLVLPIDHRELNVAGGLAADAMPVFGQISLATVIEARWHGGDRTDVPAALLDSGPVFDKAVLTVGRDVATALVAAHARGVRHGDLRPDRILLDTLGRAHVYDFAGDQHVVPAGHAYRSPEVIAAADSDVELDWEIQRRNDVHALGVVLYELLSGRLPYARHRADLEETAEARRERMSAGFSPLWATDSKWNRNLVRVIENTIATDGPPRISTAEEHLAGLRAAGRRMLRRRVVTWVAVASLAAAVVVAAVTGSHRTTEQLLTAGERHLNAHDYEAAVATHDVVLDREPENAAALRGRGLGLVGTGHYEIALSDLTRSAARDLSVRRARAYCLGQTGNWLAAENAYRQLVARGDDAVATRTNHGFCLYQLRRLDEARAAFVAAEVDRHVATLYGMALVEEAVASRDNTIPEISFVSEAAMLCDRWNVQLLAAIQFARASQRADGSAFVRYALGFAETAVEAGCDGDRLQILASIAPAIRSEPRFHQLLERGGRPDAPILPAMINPVHRSELFR